MKLKDGSDLVFDVWDAAGPGPDKRARIQADTIVGYVDGAYRVVNLSDVEELRLGVDDSTETQVAVMTGLALAVGLAVLIFFAHALSGAAY